jgi:hypothetical protein
LLQQQEPQIEAVAVAVQVLIIHLLQQTVQVQLVVLV